MAAVVIVAYYFERRRSFATGLSVCGGGIGTFLFAPITQRLIGEPEQAQCKLQFAVYSFSKGYADRMHRFFSMITFTRLVWLADDNAVFGWLFSHPLWLWVSYERLGVDKEKEQKLKQ